jgi:hypothetical protein
MSEKSGIRAARLMAVVIGLRQVYKPAIHLSIGDPGYFYNDVQCMCNSLHFIIEDQ